MNTNNEDYIDIDVYVNQMVVCPFDSKGNINENAGNFQLTTKYDYDNLKRIVDKFGTQVFSKGQKELCVWIDLHYFCYCEIGRLSEDNYDEKGVPKAISFRIKDMLVLRQLQKKYAWTYARSLDRFRTLKPEEKEKITFRVRYKSRLRDQKNMLVLEVIDKSENVKPITPEIRAIQDLIESGIYVRPTSEQMEYHPTWKITEWYDYSQLDKMAKKEFGVYCWYGFNDNYPSDKTLYIYIGIAGTKKDSKGTVAQRIKSEQEYTFYWQNAIGKIIDKVNVERFRFAYLVDDGMVTPDAFLHAIETQEITVFSSLFPCFNAKDPVASLKLRNAVTEISGKIKGKDNTTVEFENVVILNKQTGWGIVD